MKRNSENGVTLFVKHPYYGAVKTRLAEQVGSEFATTVYKHFVTDTLSALQNLGADLRILFYPPKHRAEFAAWLGSEYCYVPQMGEDLGERMKNAFEQIFAEGFSKAVVIGSDSPDLPGGFIRSAFLALENYDSVIGPAEDGGYYLLGFSKTSFLPEVFKDIVWGSPAVRTQTMNILRMHSQNIYQLPRWCDVDTLADLRSLVIRNVHSEFSRSGTFRFLLNSGIIPAASTLVWSGENV